MFTSFHSKLTQKLPYLNSVFLLLGVKLFYLMMGWLLLKCNYSEVLEVFTRNDSFWYLKIVNEGYPTVPPTPWVPDAFPFFPLYPLLVKLFQLGGLLSFHLAAFFVNIILLFLLVKGLSALNYFYQNSQKLFRFLLFWLILPYHYFFFVNYTELLFLVLFVWIMVWIEKQQWRLLGVFLMLLSLSRPTGVVAAFLLWIWKFFAKKETIQNIPNSIFKVNSWVYLCAPISLGIYMIYLHFHCGDALAFNHSVISWGRSWGSPFRGFMDWRDRDHVVMAIYTSCCLIGAAFFTAKLKLGEKIYQWGMTIFPLFSGLLVSFYRYFMVILPIQLVWFESLENNKYKKVVMLFLAAINLSTFVYWVLNHGLLSY